MFGQLVISSQLLYVYVGMFGCFDEIFFLVIIVFGIEIMFLFDQFVCVFFIFLFINGSNLIIFVVYFIGLNGIGISYVLGEVVIIGGMFYIYDDNIICSDEVFFEFMIIDELVLSCGEDMLVFGFGNVDGIGSVVIIGGVVFFLVEWSGLASGNLSISDVNVLIDNFLQGVYSLIVMDNSGCLVICIFIIMVLDCVLNFDFDVQGVICLNVFDGVVVLIVMGGDGNYIYSWSNMIMVSFIMGVLFGVYMVMVMDGIGCQVEGEVVVDILNFVL